MDSGRFSRASRSLFYCVSRTLLLLTSGPWTVQGAPVTIHPRLIKSFSSIDPSSGTWADALSSIGPLILLVGERSTKQLLRNVRGIHNAFSLAAAPLGLITIVSSIIRFCGVQRLRALIGYELEARLAAGVEMTRVNCGGVHAQMVDGYIVRSTAADPSGQAIAVSKLEGEFNALAAEAVLQIQACGDFKSEKALAGMPDDVAPVQWCLQMTTASADGEVVSSMVKTLADAVGVRSLDAATQRFQTALKGLYSHKLPSKRHHGANATEILAPHEADNHIEKSVDIAGKEDGSSTPESAPAQLTFLCTLEAVSEFATSIPVSEALTTLIGIISLLAILALQVTALWQQQWHFQSGWILMFVGYVGIVLGVTAGALLIHSSCACIALRSRSAISKDRWVDGLVISVKNTDSMDTTGSKFMRSPRALQTFEAVWRKDLTSQKSVMASAIVTLLVLSFICHYLGLRSSKWWVGAGELIICLMAAFARSVTMDRQEKFSIVEGVKIDKRCTSTGVIHMQQSQKVDRSLWNPGNLDVRAYSERTYNWHPTTAEHVAWHAAKLCVGDRKVSTRILELTGMLLAISKDGQEPGSRAVLASFLGGVLVHEGLGFPNARLGIGFRSSITQLAAPTPLFARAIMRQPQWMVDNAELGHGTIPIGNVHIFSINSMMDWWTLSEDRNDLGDLQRNLHWSLLLINIALFIALLTMPEEDSELTDAIEDSHKVSSGERETGEAIVGYFRDVFNRA